MSGEGCPWGLSVQMLSLRSSMTIRFLAQLHRIISCMKWIAMILASATILPASAQQKPDVRQVAFVVQGMT